MLAAFDFKEFFGRLGENSSSVVIVIGVLALCFALFRMNAKRIRQAKGRSEYASVRPHSAASLDTSKPRQPMRGDAEQLLVELHELGRDIEGRIETRIQYLTRLLAEADRTIERMNSAVAAVAANAANAAAVANENAVGGEDSGKRNILALAREGVDAAEIARRLGFPKGEVELILGLARRGAEEKNPPGNA